MPIILVGGGASLIDLQYFTGEVLIPDNYAIANAYGAALAEVSITYDQIVSLENRNETLKSIAKKLFMDLEKNTSHTATFRITEQIIIPFHYMTGNLARVIMTVAGKRSD